MSDVTAVLVPLRTITVITDVSLGILLMWLSGAWSLTADSMEDGRHTSSGMSATHVLALIQQHLNHATMPYQQPEPANFPIPAGNGKKFGQMIADLVNPYHSLMTFELVRFSPVVAT